MIIFGVVNMTVTLKKLELLRRIDSIVDFSRATAQLKILLAIDGSKLTVSEIVKATGLKRKTVLDALRKLEIKDLVKKSKDKYCLSIEGMQIYEALKELIKSGTLPIGKVQVRGHKIAFYENYDKLLSTAYMLLAIRIIGDSNNKPIALKKLATKLRVSPLTLEEHLSRFTETDELKVFEKVYDLKRPRTVMYRLTKLGLKLYHTIYARQISNRREILIIEIIALAVLILLYLIIL